MSDFIELTEKYAAVMLADTQSYAQAAQHDETLRFPETGRAVVGFEMPADRS